MRIVLFSILIVLNCKSHLIEPKTVSVKPNSDKILILPIEARNIYTIPQLGKDIQDLISLHLIEKGYQVSQISDLGMYKVKQESFDQRSPVLSNYPHSGEFRAVSENIQLMFSKEEFQNYIISNEIVYILQSSISVYSNESIKEPSNSIVIFVKLFNTKGSLISMSTFQSFNLELSDVYKGSFMQTTVGKLVLDMTGKLKR